MPYFESNESGSVWDHALRAMRFLAGDLGKNGLCDQHHADWNDGLEATKEAGARESVFVTMQLCLRPARDGGNRPPHRRSWRRNRKRDELYATFKNRINEVAWDGEWYTRTHCGDGYVIGSKNCTYGKIFLNTQSWAVLSGVATDERAQAIMRKVDEILETDIGYRICDPPYAEYDARVGSMSKSMPGANENGGCYNHAGGFKGVADCLLGRSETGVAHLHQNHARQPGKPDLQLRCRAVQLRQQLLVRAAGLWQKRLRLAHRHQRLDDPTHDRAHPRCPPRL